MDHGNIISLNLRNMVTIVVMVTVGWFVLHLLAQVFGGGQMVGVNYNGATSGGVSIDLGGSPA